MYVLHTTLPPCCCCPPQAPAATPTFTSITRSPTTRTRDIPISRSSIQPSTHPSIHCHLSSTTDTHSLHHSLLVSLPSFAPPVLYFHFALHLHLVARLFIIMSRSPSMSVSLCAMVLLLLSSCPLSFAGLSAYFFLDANCTQPLMYDVTDATYLDWGDLPGSAITYTSATPTCITPPANIHSPIDYNVAEGTYNCQPGTSPSTANGSLSVAEWTTAGQCQQWTTSGQSGYSGTNGPDYAYTAVVNVVNGSTAQCTGGATYYNKSMGNNVTMTGLYSIAYCVQNNNQGNGVSSGAGVSSAVVALAVLMGALVVSSRLFGLRWFTEREQLLMHISSSDVFPAPRKFSFYSSFYFSTLLFIPLLVGGSHCRHSSVSVRIQSITSVSLLLMRLHPADCNDCAACDGTASSNDTDVSPLAPDTRVRAPQTRERTSCCCQQQQRVLTEAGSCCFGEFELSVAVARAR